MNTDKAVREKVKHFSMALAKIHRLLIENEFSGMERTHGALTPAAKLQLLLHGPELAWLRPLSQLMALIDEILFQKTPLHEKDEARTLHELREFFILERDKLFTERLARTLPAVPALAHEVAALKAQLT